MKWRITEIDLTAPAIGIVIIWAVLTLSSAIRSLKPVVTITVPQTKTTVQVPKGYAPAKAWPEGVMLPRPEVAR